VICEHRRGQGHGHFWKANFAPSDSADSAFCVSRPQTSG
jgi:hypothetical protein